MNKTLNNCIWVQLALAPQLFHLGTLDLTFDFTFDRTLVAKHVQHNTRPPIRYQTLALRENTPPRLQTSLFRSIHNIDSWLPNKFQQIP